MKELVCIANIETGEVLRIDRDKAFEEFVWKKDSNWLFTNKKVYKQCVDSLKPDGNIPKPSFKKYDDEGVGKWNNAKQSQYYYK
jgi:hypothetical protein